MARWRQHGQLNMGMPYFQNFTRYEQCDAILPGAEPQLGPAFFAPGAISAAYGGVGCAWFAGGLQTLAKLAADPDAETAVEDELETFGDHLGGNLHWTEAETVFDHGGTELRIFSFLIAPGLSRGEFAAAWRAFAETFLAHEELTRHCTSYIQDHVVEGTGESRLTGSPRWASPTLRGCSG